MKRFSSVITFIAIVLIAIAITIVSCKKDDNKTDPKPQVYYDGTGEIGSNGGTIYLNDDSSPLDGTYIVIPENAMSSGQTITISQATNNADFTGSSDIIVVEFEPDGLEFTAEVEVAIPYPDNFNPDKLTVFYYKNGSTKVDVMPISSVDKTNKLVKFKTTHFSGYFTSEDGLPCPGTPTVTDEDGNVYNTVNIGGQCWMKENLNVGTFVEAPAKNPYLIEDNGQIEKLGFEDDPANCEAYGGLYFYNEFMKYNASNPQGICPDGWKIPAVEDFEALFNYSGGYWDYDASMHLKAYSVDWGYEYGDNESGFSALPGGFFDWYGYSPSGQWYGSQVTYFGVSNPDYVNASFASIGYYLDFAGDGPITTAASIRCIKAEGGNYNQAPTTPALNFPFNQADVSLPFTLQWSSTDPDNDPLIYDLFLSTNSNPDLLVNGISENTYEVTNLTAGQTYFWKVIVNDGQGHQVESEIHQFNVTGSENLPPTTPANPSPANNATIEVTETTLHWACTDPEQDPTTYDVYFGTSSSPDLAGENINQSSYPVNNLQENTTYYWRIVAKDDNENVTEGPVWSFTNQANIAPVADFSATPTSGEAPLTVNFTDLSSNNPTSWQWDFGDGGTSTQPNPSYTYNSDGPYTVSLTVSNAYGTDTKTKTNYIYVGSGGGGGEPCPGTPTVTDADGNVYNTVQIGGQCWMKENLRVGTRIDGSQEMTDNGINEKYCYDDDPSNCEIYGGLYYWDELMQYTTTQGPQGICPNGWHIPTHADWKILEGTVDTQYDVGSPEWDIEQDCNGFDVGKRLKSTFGWVEGDYGENGTDDFGFTALPGGALINGAYDHIGTFGFWPSSSKDSYNYWILMPSLSRYSDCMSLQYGWNTGLGYSVRCIRD